MIEITIIIPKADNDGDTFTDNHHAIFEAALIKSFGGLTELSTVKGAWMDQGRLYRDESKTYLVALSSIVEAGKLGALVEFAKVHYRQEMIYLRYFNVAEIL